MIARSTTVSQGLQWGAAALLIATAVALVHLSAIRQNYSHLHWEDELFFTHEQEEIHWWGDCFRKPLWPGLYRPLTTNCYYYLVGAIAGPNPTTRVQAHHLLNVVFYAANGLVLFGLGRLLLLWPWALVAAVLFVSRRAHIEIVLNTVEFQSLGASFLSLLSMLWFICARRQERPFLLGLSSLALALALLSKESAVVTPAILLVYGWLYDERKGWQWYLAPVGVAAAWGVLFVTFLRGFSSHTPTGFDYTLAPLAILANYSAYFMSIANPLASAPDNMIMPALLERLASESLMVATLSALFVLCAGIIAFHRTVSSSIGVWLRPFAFGIAFFALATAPYAILVDRLFMRYGYFGHAGLALASAAFLWGSLLAVCKALGVFIPGKSA